MLYALALLLGSTCCCGKTDTVDPLQRAVAEATSVLKTTARPAPALSPAAEHRYEKPVVVIFYLGAGCLHCVEQVKHFAARAKEFRDAGVEIVGVSQETQDAVNESIKNFGGLPFGVTGDEKLGVFKRWGVFHTWSGALHGTFLLDRQGRIRFETVGAHPYMDSGRLLERVRNLDSVYGNWTAALDEDGVDPREMASIRNAALAGGVTSAERADAERIQTEARARLEAARRTKSGKILKVAEAQMRLADQLVAALASDTSENRTRASGIRTLELSK